MRREGALPCLYSSGDVLLQYAGWGHIFMTGVTIIFNRVTRMGLGKRMEKNWEKFWQVEIYKQEDLWQKKLLPCH